MNHIKKFNEELDFDGHTSRFRKYLNKEKDIHDIFSEFSKSKRKHLKEVRALLDEVKDERYRKELVDYISYLSKIPANLMKIDGEYTGVTDAD